MKAPECIRKYFHLPQAAVMCCHCLYKTDHDPEYIDSPGYPSPVKKIPEGDVKRFQGRAYVLHSDITYSESEFQELEMAYHEVCAELDNAKLGM